MSSLPWLRLYTGMVDNEKIRLIAFEDRWHYVAILCLKQQGILDQNNELMERKIAVKLGVQLRELDEIKRRLIEVELIDEHFQPIGWENKQFPSDSSAERVRRFRGYKKKNQCNDNETLQKPSSNVIDTDTDTDTKKKNIKKEKFEEDEFILPEDIDPKRWCEWLKVRKKKKASDSTYAYKLAINQIRKCLEIGMTANDVLDYAINRSWAAINVKWIEPQQPKPQQEVNNGWGSL